MKPLRISPEQLREYARFFYALKDPLRLRILLALVQAGEMTVTELTRAVRVSQPLVSWHLGRLRAAGLVQVERDGRIARYSVAVDKIRRLLSSFDELLATISSEEK
ncbi:MAG TPA: helix-turn-helix transcriptional regulator [Thermoflexia bacterium]|nr:helix-turn-helix transcriptional regulator [Thermoflexia bacterium]